MADGEASNWQGTLARLLSQENWPEDLNEIVEKLSNNIPLSLDDGKFLFQYRDLDVIGHLAGIVKHARYGNKVFFNVNVHINQTNICTLACKFCAFRRGRRAEDAYQLEISDYIEDLYNYSNHVDEVHSVGGLHPEWGIEHYTELFRRTREEFPHIHIKALTAVEIKHIAKLSGLSILETLSRLKKSGLASLPGGGAEILDDEVRGIICRGKESSEEYLEIHRTAHYLDIPTNCTMLYGTIETIEHRVMHMIKLRELQDETAGFQCFVPYPFLPDDSRLPEAQLATGTEVLRVIAISRLMLNNIPHIKAYRMNLGDEVSELALQFGADDIDGTVQEESIMHLAGSTAPLDHDKARLAKIVSNSGSIPVQRNTTYTSFVEFNPPIVPKRRSLRMAR
ncbi:MAG: aminofutalosine synthase MqnE [Euryarchaeota archaeon]|nr:aminofutalosine synthase MqnE [Euryarchaeota archaeon]